MKIKDKITNFFFKEEKTIEETPDCCKVKEEKKKQEEKVPSCCKKPKGKKPKGFLQGLAYGLVPHAGCIAFIVFSVLGLTAAAALFKPLLMKSYFFYLMLSMSVIFATGSAIFYLKKHGSISITNAKNHKGYLSILFGSTIFISALLYFIIFPVIAGGMLTGAAVANYPDASSFVMKVAIPCPGHAPLIINELKTLDIIDVKFSFPNKFKVFYDDTTISKEEILSLEVFDEYKPTVIEESGTGDWQGDAGGSCCGAPNCGGGSTGGGCGCGG